MKKIFYPSILLVIGIVSLVVGFALEGILSALLRILGIVLVTIGAKRLGIKPK